MSEDHANQLPSDQPPTPETRADAAMDAAMTTDAENSVSAESESNDAVAGEDAGDGMADPADRTPDATDRDGETAENADLEANIEADTEADVEVAATSDGSSSESPAAELPEADDSVDDAIATDPMTQTERGAEGVTESSKKPETPETPAQSVAPKTSPPPTRIEMADADSFTSRDAFSTVIQTAQDTLDQVLAVLKKGWDVIAPIVRSVSILILRLLILTLQWALEQLEQTVPATSTTMTSAQPKSMATAQSQPVAKQSDRADESDSVAPDGEFEADTLEDNEAIAADGFTTDDNSADTDDEPSQDTTDAPNLDAAVVSTPQSVGPASESAADTADEPATKTRDRPLALRIGLTVLGFAWTVLVNVGRVVLPNRISDKLPNPVVGGLMTAIVVGILWITLSIRSAPASVPEPPPGISVPMDLTVKENPEAAEESPAEDMSEDIEAEENAEPAVEEPTETEDAEEVDEAIASDSEAQPIADTPEVNNTPEVTETPTANPPADVSLTSELMEELRDQIAEVSEDYGSDLIQSVQANFLSGRLALTVSGVWNDLGGDRPQVAKALWLRSQEYGFTKLEITDREGKVLARSPVVGQEMLMFERSAADDLAPVDDPVDEPDNEAIAVPESASESEPAAAPTEASEPQDTTASEATPESTPD
jgi:hypothetical protein